MKAGPYISRRKWLAAAPAGLSVAAFAQPPMPRRPPPARHEPGMVKIDVAEGKRIVVSNGLPDHATGDLPNFHDPVPMSAQKIQLQMPAKPIAGAKVEPLNMSLFGVAVNGVPFDP